MGHDIEIGGAAVCDGLLQPLVGISCFDALHLEMNIRERQAYDIG